jgi:long-chain acyl-CoA synthetase
MTGGIDTFQKVFLQTVKQHPNRAFLGSRNAQLNNIYQYKTYAEVFEIAENLGSGLITLNLVPELHEYENFKVRLMGIFSKNRPEWLIQDCANFLYGFAMVPLYDTLGPENISYCIDHSGMRCILAASGPIDVLLKT